MSNFGKQLYIIRKHKNLTLRELEKLSGIKFVRIGRFENNMEKPTLENISKLESALKVKFEDYEKVTREIEALYRKFIDSLIYDMSDFDYYIEVIKKNEEIYIVNSFYSLIILIMYIINIHKNNLFDIKKIEKELDRLLEPKSDYLQLYYDYKGIRLYKQGQKDEAADLLASAITLANNPKQNAMIYYHLSMVNLSRNKYIEALKFAELAKNGFVEFASFRRILYTDGQIGSIYSQMQRFDLAIDKYITCLESNKILDTSLDIKALILRNLSWIYIKSGNYTEPLSYLAEAEKLDSENVNLKMYKIWCNYKLGKYNTARNLIEQYRNLNDLKSHKKRFQLFSGLVYNADTMPTLALIRSAIEVYEEFAMNRDHELMNFYIDIVIDLLKQRDDDKRLIQYLETKIKINNEINQQRNY